MVAFKRILSAATALTLVCAGALVAKPKPNITGLVTIDGKPAAGVLVSDGNEIVKTDKKGSFGIVSDKKEGSVFVILPSGTEVEHDCGMPAFWKRLSCPVDEKESHDFALRSVDNSRHAVLFLTDLHIANNFDDIHQMRNILMRRVRSEVERYRSEGIPVYCFNGGDSSYDRYWYEYLYTIADFPATLKDMDFPVPMFCVMGNHDNDPGVGQEGDVDFRAAEAYRRAMGPTRFSANIGGIHYIFLDNVMYLNEEGRVDTYEGVTGRRNYKNGIREDEWKWLEKDLAQVSDKTTPVVVTMHSPVLCYKSGVSASKIEGRLVNLQGEDTTDSFAALFKDFPTVHFLTGHTHKNLPCYGSIGETDYKNISNIVEHNVVSASGCWWQTGSRANSLSLAPDGGPAGFETFVADKGELKWYFVSNDDGPEVQFRVFDMNSVREYYRTNGEARVFTHHYPERENYADIDDNWIYIQVWAWEPGWKISVIENGVSLPAKACKLENPQFSLSYYGAKAGWEDNNPARWPQKYGKRGPNPHFFKVRASGAETSVTVTVTDTFGKEYTQIVERPKPFSKTMR